MSAKKCYQVSHKEVYKAMIVYEFDFHGFEDGILSEGLPVKMWPQNVKVVVKGTKPAENLFCPLKPWLLISKKVRTIIENFAPQECQFLPIKVLHQSGFEISGYSILNILSMIKGLDYEKTTWLTHEKWNVEYPQLNIFEIALRKDAIKSHHIFRIKESKTEIFISKELKRLLELNKANENFSFIPINCY